MNANVNLQRGASSASADKPSNALQVVEPRTPADSNVGTAGLTAPELYLNRELTWLEFNRRVLHEAEDARTPLPEDPGCAKDVEESADLKDRTRD